jgi:hypothetical protein
VSTESPHFAPLWCPPSPPRRQSSVRAAPSEEARPVSSRTRRTPVP